MATMTLGEAMADLRDRLDEAPGDESSGVWTNVALRRCINRGVREVARRAECMEKTGTVSISAGTQSGALLGASLARNVPWPAQVDNTLGAPATVINLGVGSQTVADMNTDAATQVDPLYSASTYTKNVVVCAGGINDCLTQTAATIETRLSTYVSGRQATGYKVAICTMPPATSITGGAETVRTTVNSWITAGSSGADVVVDLAADSRLANTGDTTYFASNGIHFTTTGYGVWASLIKTGLATLGVT